MRAGSKCANRRWTIRPNATWSRASPICRTNSMTWSGRLQQKNNEDTKCSSCQSARPDGASNAARHFETSRACRARALDRHRQLRPCVLDVANSADRPDFQILVGARLEQSVQFIFAPLTTSANRARAGSPAFDRTVRPSRGSHRRSVWLRTS